MSKGTDGRVVREGRGRNGRDGRSSRTSTPMTVERARAIQAHSDRTGTNQDFKARAMSAAQTTTDE